jgi:hypothetical protein
MRVVHQPVEDAIGQGGISDLFVPAGYRQLRSQDHRARLAAILGDFPEVSYWALTGFRANGHERRATEAPQSPARKQSRNHGLADQRYKT